MPIFCPVPIVGYGSRSAELQKSIIDNWNQTASEDCRRPGHRKIAGDPGIVRLQETQASEDCWRPGHRKIAEDPGIGRLQKTRASEDCRRPGHQKIAGDPGIGRLQETRASEDCKHWGTVIITIALKHWITAILLTCYGSTSSGLTRISTPLWARGQDTFLAIYGARVQAHLAYQCCGAATFLGGSGS